MSLKARRYCGVALIGMLVCLGAGPALADDSREFPEITKKWETAYNAGDAAAVAALYSEDGMMMPPNKPGASGRKAIEAAVKADIAETPGKLVVETLDHGASGNLGFARGTFSVVDDAGKVLDKGKWVDVRKKVNGKWLIHCDIWNSDMLAAE